MKVKRDPSDPLGSSKVIALSKAEIAVMRQASEIAAKLRSFCSPDDDDDIALAEVEHTCREIAEGKFELPVPA